MKKLIVLMALLMILPALVFAQLSVGPAAFVRSPVLLGQEVDIDELNVNQFSFGGDLRYRLGWFQAEALILYSAGEINSLDVILDAGVAVDLSILTLSLGVGPNFTGNIGEGRAMQAGLNTKLGADLRFGGLTLGASYIMALDISESRFSIEKSSGLIGVHVLFQL